MKPANRSLGAAGAVDSFEAQGDPLDPAADRRIDSRSSPKERLLDAAERLFAERGFERTSIRAVTRAAGLSVSAANYHFGSKEELLRATLLRRVQSVNRRRLAQLDALERAADAPGLESVVACFLGPAVEQFEAMRQRGEGSFARHVLARLYTDPPEIVARLKAELFGEVNERFTTALASALPDASREHVAFLLQLSVGTMIHVIGGQVDERLLEGVASRMHAPTPPLLEELVRYTCAGLCASAQGPAR